MTKVTNRYTDRELIERIWVWCGDYNKIPTQRDILNDDRMPTHHTYINRFGSIKKAMEYAQIDNMTEVTSVHDAIKGLMDDSKCKFKITDEFVKVNDITIDFKVVDDDNEIYYIDLIFLKNVGDDVIKFTNMYRPLQMDGKNYIMISSIEDLALVLYSRS